MAAGYSSRGSFQKADGLRTVASASQNTVAGTVRSDLNVPMYGRFKKPVLSVGTTTQNSISTPGTKYSATCSVDSDGKLTFHSSDSLRSRLGELFTASFCHRFLEVVAEMDAPVHIGRQANDINNMALAGCVVENPSDHDTSAKCSSKNKRPESSDTFRSKRRKSCTHELKHSLPSRKAVGVKEEDRSEGPDNEESDDLEELVDTKYVSTMIRVDDEVAIERCIDDRLKRMKQVSCRGVAKAWIKAMEPRKQTRYPYNGGDRKEEASRICGQSNTGELTKPPWWPSTEGWQRGEGCRHKEPDHLKKPERLILLKHLLQKCPVAVLQESTKHPSMSLSPETDKYLNEVYRIRSQQERFNNNQIDNDTTISISLPIIDGQGVSDGTTKVEPDDSPIQENSTLLPPPDTLSVINSLDASQQEVARHCSSPLDILDEAGNELGLPSGEDMHVPAPKPEQNAVYPERHRFSDLDSFDVSMGNGTRVLEPRKYEHRYDDFRLALMPQNGNYPGDQRCLGTAANSSFQGEQAYSPGYSGNAGLPFTCSGNLKSGLAGLTEHPAEANCARADTQLTHGLAVWPALPFPNEHYGFGNASMCTPSMEAIEQEFPPPQEKFRQSWDFQRASPYSKARHCSRAASSTDPSNL